MIDFSQFQYGNLHKFFFFLLSHQPCDFFFYILPSYVCNSCSTYSVLSILFRHDEIYEWNKTAAVIEWMSRSAFIIQIFFSYSDWRKIKLKRGKKKIIIFHFNDVERDAVWCKKKNVSVSSTHIWNCIPKVRYNI
jgi:hypothetical protein